jgi:hypothetical protein
MLSKLSWKITGALWRGATIEEITEAEAAALLARRINGKLQDELRRNPRITALVRCCSDDTDRFTDFEAGVTSRR